MGASNHNNIAEVLHNVFITRGFFGRNDMPEDVIPNGVMKGSLEHLLFITLTVSIDYQRDANEVWRSSRETFEDEKTRYLFDPTLLCKTEFGKIVADMQKHGLSKKPTRDANIWYTISKTFYTKWNSNPCNFLSACNWDSILILEHLKNDAHFENNKKIKDFPNLRGPKIGPLWIRMLRDNVGLLGLKNLDKVPIPVDIHIARASLSIGMVQCKFKGRLSDIFEDIRKSWFEQVEGIVIKNRPMIALDVDEPLWHLSKYGCSKNRDKITGNCSEYENCEARKFCIKGMININKSMIELDT